MNTHDIELPHSDEAAAHMLPSDLKKFEFGEHVAEAFSIAVGNPDETSQPLFTLDQVRAAIEADRKRRQSEAEEVCAEAYQVVGSLLSDLGIFETHHAEKILDNLSQAKIVHDDVLPWPSFDRKRRGEPVNLDRYDAGLLGGQDGMPAYVWHDIIRAELDRAYDFYMDQLDRTTHQPAEPVKLCDCERGHNGMGVAGRECDCSAEPVKVPSDAEMAAIWDEAHKPFGGAPFLMSHVEYSRALLARYGQPTAREDADDLYVAYLCGLADGKKTTNTLPTPKPDPHYEEGATDVFDHAQRQAYVDGWNECLEAIKKGLKRT